MVDYVAMSNRCLWDATAAAHDERRKETFNFDGPYYTERVPFKDSIQGYQLLPKQLRPMDLVLLPSTDFNGYATRWEERYSVLSRGTIVPIVDNKPYIKNPIPGKGDFYPVIAHYGVVRVEHILVRRKFATGRPDLRVKALQAVLDQDIAYVEEDYPKAGDWGPLATENNLAPNRFELLIDPEGRILAILGASGSEPGLIPEDPISDVIAVVSLVKLATAGGRMILRVLSRRAAKRAALKAALQSETGAIRPVNDTVNVGGGGEIPNVTNLNPIKPGSGGPTSGIPNHVKGSMEEMDTLFAPNSVKNMYSVRLRYVDVDWQRATQAASKVMSPGGKVSMNVWTQTKLEADALKTAFEGAGFKDVRIWGVSPGPGTMVDAVR